MYKSFLAFTVVAAFHFLFLPSISYAVVGSVDVTVVGKNGKPVTDVTIKMTSIQAGVEGEVSEDETDYRGGALLWFHEGDSHRVEVFSSDGKKLFDRIISLESGTRGIKVDTVSGTVVDIDSGTVLDAVRERRYQVKKSFKSYALGKGNPGNLSTSGTADYTSQLTAIFSDPGTTFFSNAEFNYNDTNINESIGTTAVGIGTVTINETKSSFRQNNWNFTGGRTSDVGKNAKLGVFVNAEMNNGDLHGNGLGDFNEQFGVAGDNDLDKYSLCFIFAMRKNNLRGGIQAGASYNDKKNERSRTDSFAREENSVSDGPLKLPANPLNYHSSAFEGKIAIGKTCGPFDWDLTVTGEITRGDGDQRSSTADPLETSGISKPGNVKGYNGGGNLWGTWRVSNSLTVPVWLIVDYNDTVWDGDNTQGTGFFADNNVDLRIHNICFSSEVGAGFNWAQENGHFAIGLSKCHMSKQTNVTEVNRTPVGTIFSDLRNFQKGDTGTWDFVKGQVVAERAVSPDVKLFAGLTAKLGRVENDPQSEITDSLFGSSSEYFTNRGKFGSVNLSMGTSVKGNVATTEFSVGGEYWKLNQNNDGDGFTDGMNTEVFSGKTQCEGFSLHFSADLIF